ncbi:MAG: capsule assembly Wzi family protein [Terracidiphilus sp.]
MREQPATVLLHFYVMALSGLLLAAASSVSAAPSSVLESANQVANDSDASAKDCDLSMSGSPYIPVDSWIYPAVLRLYSLGFLDHVFLGLRPWTRASLSHMLEDTGDKIESAAAGPVADEARELYDALNHELQLDSGGPCPARAGEVRIESTYTTMRAISGTPLRDSFHLGSTIVNDFGRPYENGFNNYSGASGYATAGRFTLYARGEFQGAPSAAGYPAALAQTLSAIDQTSYFVPSGTPPYGNTTAVFNQTTIPQGPIATATQGRLLEAYVSAQFLNHVFSFGKQDEWMGPAQGASMAYSNNAENIYAFHINRTEPLYIPLLSRLAGPFRYEFLVGALRGHTYMPNPAYLANPSPALANVMNPGDPWVHAEKFSFKPTRDLEFGFERTVIWGGRGHEPITLHTFLKSFFSTNSTYYAVKDTAQDPGARFGAFDFTYRLPFRQNWLTFYSDFEAHDTPSPIAKPAHSGFRPGLYLSHVPGVPKLDVRAEGVDTDSDYPGSSGGTYQYWERIQSQGYTNQGQLFGDWIGREGKGGQGWITYHLSGNEWVQAGVRNQKAAKDFIPGGTTLNDFSVRAVKRIHKDLEIDGSFALEHWKAPVYLPGSQTVTTTTIQLTWFPERRIGF